MELVFWLLLFLIIYTYFIYPVLLHLIVKEPYAEDVIFQPFVSIIIPAFNEELLIEEKIHSIFKSDYPLDKIEVIVFSDGCTDATIDIVLNLQKQYAQIELICNAERKGKSFAINQLVKAAKSDIILLTDANIIFNNQTIGENLKRFVAPKVGLVGSVVVNLIPENGGIVLQEKSYVSWENTIKINEGKIWGTTIAPFGACFSFRKEFFKNIPVNFLVDDFFIASTILQAKKECVVETKSKCFEKINGFMKEEMMRRRRIAAGNFQNLKYFFRFYINIFKAHGFCFWSHKGIRWFTPVILILIFIINIYLLSQGIVYQILWVIQLFFYCTPLTDSLTSKLPTINKLVKFGHYFLMMNWALLKGYVDFFKGVKVGYWQMSQR